MGNQTAAITTAKLITLKLDNIEVVAGFNKRYDYGDIDGLSISIEESGLKLPIQVAETGREREDGSPIFQLIDGHRRVKAIELINERKGESIDVRAMLYPANYSEEDRLIDMIVTGAHSSTLNMLEQAHAIQELMQKRPTLRKADIARRIGKTQTHVNDCLLLLEYATPNIMNGIKSKRITATLAIEIIKAHRADAGEMLEEALEIPGTDKITKKALESIKDMRAKADARAAGGGAGQTTVVGTAPDPFKPGQKQIKNLVHGKPDTVNPVVTQLANFSDALDAQTDCEPIPEAMRALKSIISLVAGLVEPIDLIDVFMRPLAASVEVTETVLEVEEIEEEEEETLPLTPQRRKTQAVVVEVPDDEEEEAPPVEKPKRTRKPKATPAPAPVEEEKPLIATPTTDAILAALSSEPEELEEEELEEEAPPYTEPVNMSFDEALAKVKAEQEAAKAAAPAPTKTATKRATKGSKTSAPVAVIKKSTPAPVVATAELDEEEEDMPPVAAAPAPQPFVKQTPVSLSNMDWDDDESFG